MPFDFQIKIGVREGWEPLVVRLVMPVADALRLLKAHFITVATLQGKYVYWLRPSPDGKKLGLTIGRSTFEAVLHHALR
jgi:hypothetical protein